MAAAMVLDPKATSEPPATLPEMHNSTDPYSSSSSTDEDDLYSRLKSLQRQLEFIEIQEEYVKDEQKNLKRELLRAQEEVKRIQSVPLVIGQFMEMIDQNNGIVGSTTGSNYYVRILSTINRELLKPSASVALHRHSNALVDVLPPEADSSISLLSQSEKPDVSYTIKFIMADEENFNSSKDEIKEDSADIASFDLTKKKKKKKVVIQDPADETADQLVEKTENLAATDGVDNAFSGLKKKKKKQVQADLLDDEKEYVTDELEESFGEDEEGEGIVLQQRLPWEGTDRDYEYEELLGRVFNILREHNPELAGDRRRTVMRPPQVLREGTKKTVFVNFMDLCRTMHRQPEHVMTFLLAELGTSGSLDGQQRLVVKGRFAPKNFEGILRRYVNEYVICNGCKSPDTILSKENRLFFLRCEKCGSGRSVAPIKAGFVARVGRRKAGT